MRSHEERVAETKRRIAKMEREKRLRRNTVTMASAVAACLALLIGASSPCPALPRASRQAIIPALKRRQASFTAARLWDTSSSGCWRFLLGVCVTVLCFRLRQMNREDGQDKGKRGCAWS